MPTAMPPQESALTQSTMKSRKRERTVFTEEELQQLRRHFEKKHYPSAKEQEVLAEELNLQKDVVKVWFKNQRANLSKAKNRQSGQLQGVLDPQRKSSMAVDTIPGLLLLGPVAPTSRSSAPPVLAPVSEQSSGCDGIRTPLWASESVYPEISGLCVSSSHGTKEMASTSLVTQYDPSVSSPGSQDSMHDAVDTAPLENTETPTTKDTNRANLDQPTQNSLEATPAATTPTSTRPSRASRKHTTITKMKLQQLKKFFDQNPYPTYEEGLALAQRLDLKEDRVWLWFSKERNKANNRPTSPPQRLQDTHAAVPASALTPGSSVNQHEPATSRPSAQTSEDPVVPMDPSSACRSEGVSSVPATFTLSLNCAHSQPQIAVEDTATAHPCSEDSSVPISGPVTQPSAHVHVMDEPSASVTEEFPLFDDTVPPDFSGQPAPFCPGTPNEAHTHLETTDDPQVSSPGESVLVPPAVGVASLEWTKSPYPAKSWVSSLEEHCKDFFQDTQIKDGSVCMSYISDPSILQILLDPPEFMWEKFSLFDDAVSTSQVALLPASREPPTLVHADLETTDDLGAARPQDPILVQQTIVIAPLE